ncbi:MAG: cation-translocating P-type ATPase [Pyrinomonadaceae bacterium]|nr:cation-translocating P-type ATPase [Phycisphaerales bacterium]
MAAAHDHSHTHSHSHGHSHSHADEAHKFDKAHAQSGMACCSHHNIKLERYMLLYLIGGMLVLATVIAKQFFSGSIPEEIARIPAFIGALTLGFPLFLASFQELKVGKASTSSLASLAIISAVMVGKEEVAGGLAFILLVADQFVRQRAWTAERAIEELVGLTPDSARLLRDGAEIEVPLAQVKVGDVIRVRPGENLPVDGVVVKGTSTINQASLTGEAAPHEVQEHEPVYAGTTNLSGLIDIRATQVGQDTTIGKVSQLIREAEQSRTPRQLLIEQVARFFVPVALAVSFAVWFMKRGEPNAVEIAITVLVVACPSALLLSSPSAMVAAFAAAARLGIMIKRTNYLEDAAGIDTVVMDKTGTITTGKFSVSKLVPATGVEGAELLQAAANGEQHSNHPLARSILTTAQSARILPDGSDDFEEFHGRGIKARTSMGTLYVGRSSWLRELFPDQTEEIKQVEARIEGMTGVHVLRDGRYLGVVGLDDKVRSNTRDVIARLRELGVRKVAIFTGDRMSVAERVGRQVGVDVVEAECLPEEKHAQIDAMVKSGRRVMMVGDGINDGPSLAAADVGVAMGLGGSDIAANSAGVALMNDDLSRIPFLIELARKNRAIITQNIAASIVIALIGLSLAATGNLVILAAAAYHIVGDVFVIANSFRLFRFGEQYTTNDETMEHADAPVRRAASARIKPA